MEAQKKYVEEILRRVPTLPEEQLAKVVSLMDKLQADEVQKAAWSKAIEETSGKYRDSLSSTEEFSQRKQEEKALEEAAYQRRIQAQREAVAALKGKYKDAFSSTEEFMKRKEEEKQLDR